MEHETKEGTKEEPTTTKEAVAFHGKLVASSVNWEYPTCCAATTQKARPGYDSTHASEYLDSPRTLKSKVKVLATLLRGSDATCLYTGAGISTASGTPDYASVAKESKAPHRKQASESGNRLSAQPTVAHLVCAALERKKGVGVAHWLEQNHDRLGLKAGFPKHKYNEIHGAWGDNKNQVKMMDDDLRSDLEAWMSHWEHRTQLCVAMGTSMCGMAADCVANSCANREDSDLVVISLQKTPYDKHSSLKIWGLLDDVMAMLAKELKLSPRLLRKCRKTGEEWNRSHPRCFHRTPIRRASDKK